MKRLTLALAAVAAGSMFAANSALAAEKTWNYDAAYASPATPGAWDADANWTGGKPGASDDAKFTQGTQCVALPASGVTAANKVDFGGKSVFLLGGTFAPSSLANLSEAKIYSAFRPAAAVSLNGISLADDVLSTSDKAWTMTVGGFHYRADLYATSADEDRGVVASIGAINAADGFRLIGPRGNAATSGVWAKVEGNDSILSWVSGPTVNSTMKDNYANLQIGAGVTVHGDGVADGTFIRRVYPTQKLIELSKPVSWGEDVTQVTLAFDAYSPKAQVTVEKLYRWSFPDNGIWTGQYRAEDDFRIEIPYMSMQNRGSGDRTFDLKTPAGLVPATIVLHDTEDYFYFPSGIKLLKITNTHLEFAQSRAGAVPGARNLAFFDTGNYTARLTATNNIAAYVQLFTNFSAKVVKDGAGSLTISNLCTTANAAVEVEAGTLALGKATDGGVTTFKSVAIGANGTLSILKGATIEAKSFTAAAGAKLTGEGTLRIPSSDWAQLASVTADESVVIEVIGATSPAVLPFGNVDAKVVGNPAIWLDAAAKKSFAFWDDTALTVKRWNDCRGSGAGYMFATNISGSADLAPNVEVDSQGNYTMVKIPAVGNVQGHFEKTRAMAFSSIVKGSKAVFVVQSTGSDGPLNVLGGTFANNGNTDECGGWCGPFGRANAQGSWNKPIVNASVIATNVKDGPFYLDGRLVDPTTDDYGSSGMHLVESYPAAKGCWVDALGIGVNRNNASGNAHDGRSYYHEIVVYTNELTYVEQVQVREYLAQKWLHRGFDYASIAAEGDKSVLPSAVPNLSVASGTALGVENFSGEVNKFGDGLLAIFGADSSAKLTVSAGSVLLRSVHAASGAKLPKDKLFYHLDMADESTYELLSADVGETRLKKVFDRNGGDIHIRTVNKDDHAMSLRPDELNGLPTLDFGPLSADGDYASDDGAWAKFYDGDTAFVRGCDDTNLDAHKMKSVFMVVGNQGGGNSLLGQEYNAYPSYGWVRDVYDKDAKAPKANSATLPILTSADGYVFLGNSTSAGWAEAKKKRMFRVDGVGVDPFVDNLKEGYQLVSYVGSIGAHVYSLAEGGALYSWLGGLRYGELIMSREVFSGFERTYAEAYLAKKWFDRETHGYCPMSLASLAVSEGALVEIDGDAPVTVGAFSGSGTVKGSVALSAAATIDVAIKDGAVSGVTVTGGVDFSKGGTVVVHGNPKGLVAGAYPLVTAAGADFGEATWTLDVETPYRGRDLTLRKTATGLILDVAKAGTLLIVR